MRPGTRQLVFGAAVVMLCLTGCGHASRNSYATKCLRYALGVNDAHPRYFGIAECYASTRLDKSSESVEASCPTRSRLDATNFQYTCSVTGPKQLRGTWTVYGGDGISISYRYGR